MPKICILVPCYKRPEYTKMCISALEQAQEYKNAQFFLVDDGSLDETGKILSQANLPGRTLTHSINAGLRASIIEFFDYVQKESPDYIVKVDNDCLVPKNWLTDLTNIFEENQADILSPNVSETNAAHKYGSLKHRTSNFIPSQIVGGLWFMKKSMIDGIFFEKIGSRGIRAAFHIINQIIVEKSPKIGWTDKVTFQDVGHWFGTHPYHIKSSDHQNYSSEIGRRIAWSTRNDNKKEETHNAGQIDKENIQEIGKVPTNQPV